MSFCFNAHGKPGSPEFVSLSTLSVGVGAGGSVAMLARVSLVDYRGTTILDTFVAPTTAVVSYRTSTTGIEPHHLAGAPSFNQVQTAVASAVRGKTIIGHSLWKDFQVLGLTHPAVDTRDIGLFMPFRQAVRQPNQVVGLSTLVWHLMRHQIQATVVDSLENARASIDLFRSHEQEWENVIRMGQWPCALPPSNFSRCYT